MLRSFKCHRMCISPENIDVFTLETLYYRIALETTNPPSSLDLQPRVIIMCFFHLKRVKGKSNDGE